MPAAAVSGSRADSGDGRGVRGGSFDLVLAADVLFSVGDIEPLVKAVACLPRMPSLLGGGVGPRALVAHSRWFGRLVLTLLASFEAAGMRLVPEGVRLLTGADGAQGGEAEASVLEIAWEVEREAEIKEPSAAAAPGGVQPSVPPPST